MGLMVNGITDSLNPLSARFPNDACIASTTKNGTCYTASECETRNGVNDGSCAQGYGVCCTCEHYLYDVRTEWGIRVERIEGRFRESDSYLQAD